MTMMTALIQSMDFGFMGRAEVWLRWSWLVWGRRQAVWHGGTFLSLLNEFAYLRFDTVPPRIWGTRKRHYAEGRRLRSAAQRTVRTTLLAHARLIYVTSRLWEPNRSEMAKQTLLVSGA